MNLVVVSGPEATGKSAISREIVRLLGYQYQTKDTIKEALFDAKLHSTWDYAWYEKRAKNKFFGDIQHFVAQNKSAVVESDFTAEDKKRFAACLNDTVVITEIYCTTKGFTSFKRFVWRNETGRRHTGHHDRRWYVKILLQDLLKYLGIRWPHQPLGFTKRILTVDTTDFTRVDYKKIANFTKQAH
jgi:hypothetical protein